MNVVTLTPEEAIEQLCKVEQTWCPDEMEDWPLEGIEQFVVCVKEILRAVSVRVPLAVFLLLVLSVVPAVAQTAYTSMESAEPPLVLFVSANFAANSRGRLLPSSRIDPLRGNGVQVGLPSVSGVAR